MQLGEFTLRWFSDGNYKLDGGAMFGVVPKVVWTRKYPVDENNFIPLALNAVLIETPEAKVLIDTGYGTKLTPKQVTMFHLEQPPTLLGSLAEGGVRPEEIDFVVYSHMHHDHASGATYRDDAGNLRATFPRAKHVMQRLEWEEAKSPNIRSAHAYWEENWAVLEAEGLIMPVDGEVELTPGVRLIPTGGHTRGHQAVLITSQGQTAMHLGDLLPTRAHINPLWVMAYDDYPMDSIAAKEKWIGRAKAEGWWLTLYHDPEVHAGIWDAEGKLVQSVRADALMAER
jgi:glyoxylase-like metal-dependent hydrolase (beta-lactamase superfamily II)